MVICPSAFVIICPSGVMVICPSGFVVTCLSGFVAICPSGFMVVCPSGFMVICPSGFVVICPSGVMFICSSGVMVILTRILLTPARPSSANSKATQLKCRMLNKCSHTKAIPLNTSLETSRWQDRCTVFIVGFVNLQRTAVSVKNVNPIKTILAAINTAPLPPPPFRPLPRFSLVLFVVYSLEILFETLYCIEVIQFGKCYDFNGK